MIKNEFLFPIFWQTISYPLPKERNLVKHLTDCCCCFCFACFFICFCFFYLFVCCRVWWVQLTLLVYPFLSDNATYPRGRCWEFFVCFFYNEEKGWKKKMSRNHFRMKKMCLKIATKNPLGSLLQPWVTQGLILNVFFRVILVSANVWRLNRYFNT